MRMFASHIGDAHILMACTLTIVDMDIYEVVD